MNSKLTLRMNTKVVAEVKKYAERRDTSLSALAESYFSYLAFNSKKKRLKKNSVVDELKGSVKIPDGFDWKKEKADYLINKYIH